MPNPVLLCIMDFEIYWKENIFFLPFACCRLNIKLTLNFNMAEHSRTHSNSWVSGSNNPCNFRKIDLPDEKKKIEDFC